MNFCNDTLRMRMVDELIFRKIQKYYRKYLKAKSILQKVEDIQIPRSWYFEVTVKYVTVKRV